METIIRISRSQCGSYRIMNRNVAFRISFFVVIIYMFIGCGADTNMDAVVLVEVKPPRVRVGSDRNTWQAEFDIVFQGVPVDLQAEFVQGFHRFKDADWEQTGNIVTLHFEFKLASIEERIGPTEAPERTLIFPREHQKKSVEVTITWADGRKTFTVEAFPPPSMFVGRTDIFFI